MLIVPKSITIGDRLIWRHRDLRGLDPETGNPVTFDPAIYQLSWSFRAVGSINGDSSLDVIATNDNGEFLTIVDSTNLLGAGTYYYQAYITKNLLRRTIQSGAVEAVINYAASPDFDGRNQLEKDLEIINQAIRAVVSGGVQSYSIQGRSLSKLSLSELMSLRDSYRAELQREQSAKAVLRGEANPRRAFVRFGR